MRVLVCGGRDYGQKEGEDVLLEDVLNNLYENWYENGDQINYGGVDEDETFVLINGAARGADQMSSNWFYCRMDPELLEDGLVQLVEIPADWDKWGKQAGIYRNQEMIKLKPHVVVACPGGKGTQHMVTLAAKHKCDIIFVEGVASELEYLR